MTLTFNLTRKLISTVANFLNFSIFPNIVTFSLILLATPMIFLSHHPLSKPLVFMLIQSPSLITILFYLSLPTTLNFPLLSRYLLALGLNLIKNLLSLSNLFLLLLLTFLLSLTLMTLFLL